MLDPCTITLPMASVHRAIAYWLGRCVLLREVRVEVPGAKQVNGYYAGELESLSVRIEEIPCEPRGEDEPTLVEGLEVRQ